MTVIPTASPQHCVITGGSGFFGGILKRRLLELGWKCVNFDIVTDEDRHLNLTSYQLDLRNRAAVRSTLEKHSSTVIFHCAAMLAHEVKDKSALWDSNVEGTRNLADAAAAIGVKKIVYTSTNCLWGRVLGRPVREDDPPEPIEIYGKSKWEGEKILLSHKDHFDSVIIRCPTITDAGRLGLLTILFEFIAEGRRVWVVGRGDNRYQFVYAQDLAAACVYAATHPGSGVFNVGSDNVRTMREVYEEVIRRAGTGARVRSLPRLPTLMAMRLAYWLGVSPLGPYHYKMIAESFQFDNSKAKREIGFVPTASNEEMLWRTYEYYRDHTEELRNNPAPPPTVGRQRSARSSC